MAEDKVIRPNFLHDLNCLYRAQQIAGYSRSWVWNQLTKQYGESVTYDEAVLVANTLGFKPGWVTMNWGGAQEEPKSRSHGECYRDQVKSQGSTPDERVLGLKKPYTPDDLTKAWREYAKKNHPDVGGTNEDLIRGREAYERLRFAVR